MFGEELDRVRKVSKETGCESWTSLDYQNHILNYLMENRDRGFEGVIEIGCYKGGLSAMLGFICQQFKWPFFAVDIDENSILSTRRLLSSLMLLENATIHHGTLASFARTAVLKQRPVLIILDGDHRYEAVVDDIQMVYSLNKLPLAAAFHDYSLRHPSSGEKVDQAVKNCFGDWPIQHIGALMDGTGPYPTRERPAEDGHWWDVPGYEGALVQLPSKLTNMVIEPQPVLQRKSLLSSILRRLGAN
ncbi:class I SAM-dependent methyltransferase [Rhizobium lusitanum]|uniref:Class I SAM-dependent methyltransferase n=1 Tax=Rhizobium lusitanum TaxID=293958 RepID=A0A7X0IVP6_9HYPH|nr:class I SAM-dependent methyltransferase [Rhizobium lusitanum]MBB6487482.1 hypothetical protein [Rhizobium lusitanum]